MNILSDSTMSMTESSDTHVRNLLSLSNIEKSYRKDSISRDYNHQIPNIDTVNSDTHTLRIQYGYTQTQYDEGARDGIDIWYMGITCIYVPMIRSVSWLKSPILQSTIESVAWISSRLVLRSANTS